MDKDFIGDLDHNLRLPNANAKIIVNYIIVEILFPNSVEHNILVLGF